MLNKQYKREKKTNKTQNIIKKIISSVKYSIFLNGHLNKKNSDMY